MQNESQQIDVAPEILVLGHKEEESPDLETNLSRKKSVTCNTSHKEGEMTPAFNSNEAEQIEVVPEFNYLPHIQKEHSVEIKVNQDEKPVQKAEKENDKKVDFERKDTADTIAIEVVRSASKVVESSTDISEGLRARFIRKVLFILFAQLVLISLMVGMVFIPNTQYKTGIQNNPIIALVTVIISILSLMFLICNRKNLKRVPWNYILLFTFTCSSSYSLTYLASYTQSPIVLIAAISTVLVIIGATISAWKAKDDFSKLGYCLYQILPIAVVVLVVGLAFPSHIVQAAISAGIALLFSVYLTYDIHRLIGNFENKYTLDDYILAALDIYIDVYMIFVEVMKLIQHLVQN